VRLETYGQDEGSKDQTASTGDKESGCGSFGREDTTEAGSKEKHLQARLPRQVR